MISSGIPRSKGLGGITRIISARTTAKTVKRPTKSTGSLGESSDDSTTDHTEDLWVFEPRESVSTNIVGERLEGALNALAIADGTVDIQHNDRLVHGGVEYEVDTVVGQPNDNDADGSQSDGTDFWIISFERRQ
jgi:hypothetical protein